MSQVAARMIPSTVGSNARALSAEELRPSGQPASEVRAPRTRTPLSLVVSSPRRSRTPLVVSLFLLMVGALAAVLVMSVSVSEGQYQLVDLKNQQSALEKSNQALQLNLSAQEAPQSLVARAVGMGMVPAATSGQIDVRTKKVTGAPLPAAADTKPLSVLPPADINQPVPAAADTAAPPAAKTTTAAQDGGAAAAAAKKKAGTAAAAPAAVTPDLNGGTIPAPAQKAS
ncbi:hypothetical protein [Arthrobacter dokdonensis]|uniref:hypothetical protein n=1 Tax=Arthrobacter dokdonellae TaxID=2211210 RepID=UPI000DE5BEEA|nr:hypothetical protein [Arthrobacter dokdonellae]